MNNESGTTSNPTITQSVRALVDQGAETVETIKTRVGDVTDQVKQGGAAARTHTTTYIQANPLKSLVIAYAAGYIAMRLRTSPLVKIALVGTLGYLGTRFVRR